LEARIWIPERVVTGRSKSVAGVYARIRGPYLLMMALAGPPEARRWEPHILVDRASLVPGDHGAGFAAGPVFLARHEGLRELARRAAGARVHVAPWGAPTILVIDYRPLEPDEEAALAQAHAKKILETIKHLAPKIEVVEA